MKLLEGEIDSVLLKWKGASTIKNARSSATTL